MLSPLCLWHCFIQAGHLTLNIVGSVVSAYLILRCTFSYYVDEAGGVGCTGADVCSEQVGASCLQMVCPAGPSCLQKQLLPAATNLHPPLQSLPCVQCGLTILGNPVGSSRVSLVVTSWDIVLFEAADRSRVLVQSGWKTQHASWFLDPDCPPSLHLHRHTQTQFFLLDS